MADQKAARLVKRIRVGAKVLLTLAKEAAAPQPTEVEETMAVYNGLTAMFEEVKNPVNALQGTAMQLGAQLAARFPEGSQAAWLTQIDGWIDHGMKNERANMARAQQPTDEGAPL